MRPTYRKTLFALLVALLVPYLPTSLTFAQSGSLALVSSPDQGPNGNHLFGVSAASTSDIWAVGQDFQQTNILKTLTERYQSC